MQRPSEPPDDLSNDILDGPAFTQRRRYPINWRECVKEVAQREALRFKIAEQQLGVERFISGFGRVSLLHEDPVVHVVRATR